MINLELTQVTHNEASLFKEGDLLQFTTVYTNDRLTKRMLNTARSLIDSGKFLDLSDIMMTNSLLIQSSHATYYAKLATSEAEVAGNRITVTTTWTWDTTGVAPGTYLAKAQRIPITASLLAEREILHGLAEDLAKTNAMIAAKRKVLDRSQTLLLDAEKEEDTASTELENIRRELLIKETELNHHAEAGAVIEEKIANVSLGLESHTTKMKQLKKEDVEKKASFQLHINSLNDEIKSLKYDLQQNKQLVKEYKHAHKEAGDRVAKINEEIISSRRSIARYAALVASDDKELNELEIQARELQREFDQLQVKLMVLAAFEPPVTEQGLAEHLEPSEFDVPGVSLVAGIDAATATRREH